MKQVLQKQILLFSFFLTAHSFVRGQIITTVAGGVTGHGVYWGDGGPADSATVDAANAVVDKFGNIYIADGNNQRIRKVDAATGIINTVAGTGIAGYNGDGILATNAQLNAPDCVSVDTSGNFYISDLNNYRIRKVNINTGIITTIAGNGMEGSSGDGGPATAAKIWGGGTAWDTFGNMYLSDSARIRKVDAAGNISTIAGTGYAGCPVDSILATTTFISKLGAFICTDLLGNVYLSTGDGCVSVHKINVATGIITKVAGTSDYIGSPYSGDGIPATSCHISPLGIAVDGIGNLYIADPTNVRIEKVDTAGIIYTVAGTGVAGFSGDGGLAVNAEINYPEFAATDICGNLYISDFVNKRIRKVAFNPACWPEKVPQIASTEVAIHPNPATDVLNIDGVKAGAKYALLNITGIMLQNGTLKKGNNSISIQSLPSGVYLLVLIDNEGNKTIKKIVKE